MKRRVLTIGAVATVATFGGCAAPWGANSEPIMLEVGDTADAETITWSVVETRTESRGLSGRPELRGVRVETCLTLQASENRSVSGASWMLADAGGGQYMGDDTEAWLGFLPAYPSDTPVTLMPGECVNGWLVVEEDDPLVAAVYLEADSDVIWDLPR